MSGMDAPTPESYWVEPGALLAGKYPRTQAIDALLGSGVTLFVDLTQEAELEAYAHLVGPGVRHVRMGIPDMDVASAEKMRRTLDLIDREHARGGTAYVHCRGGAGRTGTVVGCWLVRRGLTGDAALERIAALRAGSPALWLASPETEYQRRMVRDWREL